MADAELEVMRRRAERAEALLKTFKTRRDEIVAEAVRVSAKYLRTTHWDGHGCGTNGSNGCSRCYGPSPADAVEVAEDVLDASWPVLAAALSVAPQPEPGEPMPYSGADVEGSLGDDLVSPAGVRRAYAERFAASLPAEPAKCEHGSPGAHEAILCPTCGSRDWVLTRHEDYVSATCLTCGRFEDIGWAVARYTTCPGPAPGGKLCDHLAFSHVGGSVFDSWRICGGCGVTYNANDPYRNQ